MVDAAAGFGYETGYVENVAQSDYATMFREYAEMGYNVISPPGNDGVYDAWSCSGIPGNKFRPC